MKSFMNGLFSYVLPVLAVYAIPATSYAYLGPGAGLSAIGSIIAIVFAVIVAIFGFVWYPLKRLMRKKKQQGAEEAE